MVKKKYDLFISSGTPESELKLICKKRNLRNFFLNIYGSPKSKIQHINLIKKKYSKLATFIFVGDSENDLYAAMKTKIDFIQVGNNIKKKSKKIIKIRNLRKLNSKILKL